jgi:ribosomal protein L1
MAKKKTVLIDDSKKEEAKKDPSSKVKKLTKPQVEKDQKPETVPTESTRKQKKGRSKKYQDLAKTVDKEKLYSPQEAIKLAKVTARTSFDGNLEAHLSTTITGELGELSLPYQKRAKEKKIALVTPALIEEIKKGEINFDLLIATPKDMPKLVPLARTLGPKGLMPNPKNGTLTDKPKEALKKFQAGGTKIKTEKKDPVAHLLLGKISQPEKELLANLDALVACVQPLNIKKLTLNATMGPGIKLDLSSFQG